MKFIAELPIDCLLQSAVEVASSEIDVQQYIFQKALVTLNHHILNNSNDASLWESDQDKVVIHLLNYIHELGNNNIENSILEEQRFDELTPLIDFPWQKVKLIFLELFKKFNQELVYRDWKIEGKGNINFGVIDYLIPSNAKIAIIGDWGTGGSDAQALLDELLNYTDKPDVIIHLGDIYYSCTEGEMKDNFFYPLKNAFCKAGYTVPVYCIPGNHDYFVGGQPFYNLIDTFNDDVDCNDAIANLKYKQVASYFCLRTQDSSWQFLGADTGINDHDPNKRISNPPVRSSELEWHKDKLKNFPGKTLFMSHHPLINAITNLSHSSNPDLQPFNLNLLDQFGTEFGDGNNLLPKIDFWLWGHDHYMVPIKNEIKVSDSKIGTRVIPKCRLLGGSARETGDHSLKFKYPNLIQRDKNNDLIIPNNNNQLVNHTWCLVDLGIKKIKYFQIPAWDDGTTHITSLPKGQKFIFFEENI